MKWKIERIDKHENIGRTTTGGYAVDSIEIKFRHPFTYNVLNEPVYLIDVFGKGERLVQYQNGTIEYWVKDGDIDVED